MSVTTFRGVVYTSDQIKAYLSRIDFPADVPRPTADNVTSEYGLDYLRRLAKYQLQACPFENLNIHYTKVVIKSLEPKDLYEKFVTHRRGGTCTENNTFFGIVLRTLGFKVRPVGARVSNAIEGKGKEGYGGWNHCINLCTFDGRKYLVDVAMGPTSPTQPMPLEDGATAPGVGITTCRLRYDTLPVYTDPDCKLWIYEQDNDGKSDFVPTYCFTELEFLPTDYEVMKNGTTFNRKSWFTWRIVSISHIMDKETEEIIGSLILVNNSLRRRVRGKSEVIATFSNESERVQALERYFGIQLTEEERLGIRGMVTDLGDGGVTEKIN